MNVKERKFIEAKLAGKNNSEAGLIANPKIKPSNAGVTGHRLAHSANVQAELARILKKNKITLERAVKPIAEALDAERIVVAGRGEFATIEHVVDHGTRLKASAMSLDLLGVKKDAAPAPVGSGVDAAALLEAMRDKDIDFVKLQQIVFGKNS